MILFVSLGLIWGLPYLLIKVAVEHVDPAFVVFVRVLLGAAVLLPIVLARGQWALLRGHWRWVVAFALVETASHTLYAARDRVGKKPFYWTRQGDRFAFASEPKAVLAEPGFRPEPDLQAVSQFLSYQYIPL